MANSSVLELAKSFCREYGLPVPGGLQGSSDSGALQLRELLQTVGEDIWDQTNWQQCSRRAVWTSVAGSDQGLLDTLFPEGFDCIINQTFWDLDIRQPVYGPVGELAWQAEQALTPAGPLYSFRVDGNHLLVTDSMPAGHSLSLFYKSRYWIESGGSGAEAFSLDADTSVFSDKLMKAGLRAFWLRAKQMPHRLEMEKYEDMKLAEASRGTVQPILRMDNISQVGQPGIIIPRGNWTIP